jgi:Spy/CpxP family protein refolding chaperone
MHKTFSSMGLVMMLLVGAVSPALAQGPGANSPPGAGRGAMGQKGPISNLTPEQQTKIAALRAAAVEKAAPLRGELDAKMVEMRQLWAAEKPDRKAITGKQAEMDAIHQKMRAIWTDFGLEVHALLTPCPEGGVGTGRSWPRHGHGPWNDGRRRPQGPARRGSRTWPRHGHGARNGHGHGARNGRVSLRLAHVPDEPIARNL